MPSGAEPIETEYSALSLYILLAQGQGVHRAIISRP